MATLPTVDMTSIQLSPTSPRASSRDTSLPAGTLPLSPNGELRPMSRNAPRPLERLADCHEEPPYVLSRKPPHLSVVGDLYPLVFDLVPTTWSNLDHE